MIGTNLPAILQGFIPTILNPILGYGESNEEEKSSISKIVELQPFMKANTVEVTLCLFLLIFILNIIVLVLCVSFAFRQRKPLAGIAGLLPIYNVIWLSKQTRISNWFLVVYSLLHALLLFIFAYNLNLFGLF
jgi:uncharacterized membrane protein